jgi:hypothetical protein
MFNLFRKPEPPPPPPKKWYNQPALILSIVTVFILSPVGVIYKGITEELKKKADYDTVILILKQQKENDDRQWKEIERNREPQQKVSRIVSAPTEIKLKVVLTPEEFEKYISLPPEVRAGYKKYLKSTGKDVSGLPD